jgi:SagB-type dehydrogenase family enzyme
MTPESEAACRKFQRTTSYVEADLTKEDKPLDMSKQVPVYRSFPNALATVKLPPVDPKLGSRTFYEVLHARRSKRNFIDKPVELEKLTFMLWANGLTYDMGNYQLRSSASAGALYPTETYVVVKDVAGLEPGLYYYVVKDASLQLLRRGDLSEDICRAMLGQEVARYAAFNLVCTGLIIRSSWKYQERAYRYIYLDAGHVAQNYQNAAEACGLASCAVGAFLDDVTAKLVGTDVDTEPPIVVISAGYVKGVSLAEDRRVPADKKPKK